MSHLVAIAYPDVATATEVRHRLLELQRENRIAVEDAVVVEKRIDDQLRLHQLDQAQAHAQANAQGRAARGQAADGAAGRAATWGLMWGGLIGLMFMVPFVGMAVGATAGTAAGSATDPGIDSDFMKELGKNLQPGGAALFLLTLQDTPDKVIEEIGQFGGKVVKTSLSRAAEEQLREAVQAAQQQEQQAQAAQAAGQATQDARSGSRR